MNLQQFGIANVVLGVVLLTVSFAWTSVIPNKAVWTEEQASAYQEASAKFHFDSFDKELNEEERTESEANYEANRKLLDRAIGKKHGTPTYLRIASLVVCGLGIGLILGQRANA